MHTSYGDMEIDIPRDRNGEYEPQIIKKYQNFSPAWDHKRRRLIHIIAAANFVCAVANPSRLVCESLLAFYSICAIKNVVAIVSYDVLIRQRTLNLGEWEIWETSCDKVFCGLLALGVANIDCYD